MTTTETSTHIAQAEGLRALADFIEQNPDHAGMFEHTLDYSGINAHLQHVTPEERAGAMAEVARTALRAGASVDKEVSDTMYNLAIRFGAVKVKVLAYREEVCERVQVGTKTVTRVEHDPEDVEKALRVLPEIEVTEEVPVYEWQCKPLLTADGGS